MIHINKIYEKIKKYIIENLRFIVVFLLLLLVVNYEFPYYVNAPGGIISIKEKLLIDGETLNNDFFNLTYVSEYRGTIPNLILAKIFKSWDIVKKEDVSSNESDEDESFRNHIMLEEGNENALIVALTEANIDFYTSNRQIFITYVDEVSNTDLEIQDQVISIDGVNITSKSDITSIIDSKDVDDKIIITVKSNGQMADRYAIIRDVEGEKKLGILVSETKDVITAKEITFNFNQNESGPSGGLMMALALYDAFTDNSLVSDIKIAGTGAIDEDGNVSSIGGVEYKIKGAYNDDVEVFLVPSGENYEDALEVVQENNYHMTIVPISNINEAISYLLQIK
ncbi:MAG: hypothetical protein PHE54_04620 [Bacilli bacterium]|nr:hypothetical protein [Bacilli bacterium]